MLITTRLIVTVSITILPDQANKWKDQPRSEYLIQFLVPLYAANVNNVAIIRKLHSTSIIKRTTGVSRGPGTPESRTNLHDVSVYHHNRRKCTRLEHAAPRNETGSGCEN